MKKSLFISLLFSATTFAAPVHHGLGWKLFQMEAKSLDNVFLSPMSLYVALTLTYEGGRGDIRKKASDFLGISETNGHFHPPLLDEMKNLEMSRNVKFRSANAIWTDSEKGNRWGLVPPSKQYADYVKAYYSAEIAALSFEPPEKAVKVINSWVEKQTSDMIRNFLTPMDVRGSNVAVVNAVYFKAEWENKFEVVSTRESDFLTSKGNVKASFMNQTSWFPFADTKEFKIIDLPYHGNEVAMTIILPKNDLRSLIKKLYPALIDEAVKGMKKTNVWVSLPKFQLEWGAKDLTQSLKNLGMPVAGDFTDLGHKVFSIQRVLQKTIISVDENGSEAAAATAVMARAGSAPIKPVEFHADKPFLFFLRNVKSGDWIFLGQLTSPK